MAKCGFMISQGTAREAVELAREAEAAGWDGVFTWDGISIGPSDTWDPWSLLAAMAVATTRVMLGAIVFALARRSPWEVARQALTIDHLSGGRLVLPVGLGAVDDAAFSQVLAAPKSARERAERLDDCLDFLTLAWWGEPFAFDGRHVSAGEMQFLPRPVHGSISVWAVAQWGSPRSMARAWRHQGMMPFVREPGGLTPAIVQEIRAGWEGSAPFEIVHEMQSTGDADTDIKALGPLAEAGVTWFIESRWDEGDTTDSLRERIRLGPPTLP